MQNRNQSGKSGGTPPNTSVFLFFRLAASAYLLYLVYQMVSLYKAGGSEAPSLFLLILSIVFLGGSAIAIAWVSLRQYKRFLADASASRNADSEAISEAVPDDTEMNLDAISDTESCKTDVETDKP